MRILSVLFLSSLLCVGSSCGMERIEFCGMLQRAGGVPLQDAIIMNNPDQPIFQAAKDAEIAKALLYKHERAETVTQLFQTINNNEPLIVAQMVQLCPDLLHEYSYFPGLCEKVSALHLAAACGHKKCVAVLLENKADPNILTGEHNAPLHYVKRAKVAQLLLDYQAQVDQKSKHGVTPLWNSFFCKNTLCKKFDESDEIILMLIKAGADVNQSNAGCGSLFHEAVAKGCARHVDILLSNGADPDKHNAKGLTPFGRAIRDGSSENVLAVFEKYGLLFFPHMSPVTLFKLPADWNKFTKTSASYPYFNNWAQLFIAAQRNKKNKIGNFSTANGVISNAYGCIVKNISQDDLRSFFTEEVFDFIHVVLQCQCSGAKDALCGNEIEKFKKIITTFPFITTYDVDIAHCMLLEAIKKDNTVFLEKLLEYKIDCHRLLDFIGGYNRYGATFLHHAVYCNNVRAIELLVAHGVDLLQRDGHGKTPMQYAIELERTDCIKALNSIVLSQFLVSFTVRNYKKSKKFLAEIVNPNEIMGNDDIRLMHLTVQTGGNLKTFIPLLIAKGAYINIRNKKGETPLWRLMGDNIERVMGDIKILLQHGARVNIMCDGCPQSMLSIALLRKKFALAELLLQYGAVVEEVHLQYQELPEAVREKLQVICKNQKCCVCFERPKDLSDIPCKQRHINTFICKECCDQLKAGGQACPYCRGVMDKYGA